MAKDHIKKRRSKPSESIYSLNPVDHLWTTGMQKSTINDDRSRWMKRLAFRYDFGELAAGKWRGCCGLITRRALGSSPGCPIFLSTSDITNFKSEVTCQALPKCGFSAIFPQITGINQNYLLVHPFFTPSSRIHQRSTSS